jgi:hypothetical protein
MTPTGEHHYHYHYVFGAPQKQQQRDSEKKAACESLGITFIEIPFWWDRSIESVSATIKNYRPGSCLACPAESVADIVQKHSQLLAANQYEKKSLQVH